MFESYFFDKHMLTNYRVFRVMKALSTSSFTVTRLAEVVGLSYAQTYAAFQAIMKDLQSLGIVPEAAVNEVTFQHIAKAITVDQYRLHLLDQSPSFNLFRYLFTAPVPNVHEFCADHHYNITTLRRRAAAYKRYLASCHITLNTSTWALEGAEVQIRLAMETFFLLGYRGNGWPFTAALDATVRDHLARLTPAVRQQWFIPLASAMQDRMRLACQLLRQRQGHLLPELPALSYLEQAEKRPLPPLFTDDELSDAHRQTETLFYCFMQLHSLSFDLQPTPATSWLLSRFGALEVAPVVYAKGLVDWLDQHEQALGGEPANNDRMLANLYRIAYSFAVVGTNFSRRVDFYSSDELGSDHGALASCINAYAAQLPTTGVLGEFHDLAPLMTTGLFLTTARCYPQLNTDHCLKVATLVDPGTFAIRDLLQFLAGIQFVKLVAPADYREADLIITTLVDPADAGTELRPDTPVIHWQTTATDNDYFRLYTALQTACERHNRR
ncbi:helix-turn-helix domain-containing protein [Lacticaseibacillus nasuensis]|uniref:helix-turn-helix domain-containing protein n=1 Tax=Lacticaseibacillus nasuensis TaxID=944671 RepID=UPI002248685F|nr:helix-turn-helix domain-containing protein [Lacticaseibacillus nasuensis]MCX2455346.1 helix-turn-helix domain-containing protein [Lacticaseibacillus nasuensis]